MATKTNKIYFITAGNRGLGLGLVKALLARPSTTVIATARNEDGIASLKAENISYGQGSQLYTFPLDLGSAPDPRVLVALFQNAVDNSLSHIDVLINNAACFPPMHSTVSIPAAELREAFETNTIVPLAVFQAFHPLLLKSPTGSPRVINISSSVGSIAAQEPFPGGAYGPSKAALNWITRSLHLQHEAEGLVAVALHPGWVKTRAGEFAAKEWGVDVEPPVSVEESVKGMLEIVDGASRERYGGKFMSFDGSEIPW